MPDIDDLRVSFEAGLFQDTLRPRNVSTCFRQSFRS
jgi:hypothetical protein